MNSGGVPPTPLAPDPSGSAKEVSWFRQLLRNIRERTIRTGPGLRCSYTTEGTLVELGEGEAPITGGGGTSGAIKRLQLWAAGVASDGGFANYYTTYEEDGEGNFIVQGPHVAVPFFYRPSTYDLGGSAANYTGGIRFSAVSGVIKAHGSGGENDFLTKVLFPSYALRQMIYAGSVDVGTDVYALPPDQERVMWVDLTARTLITVPQDFNVCQDVGGVPTTRQALIDGGPIH